MKVNIIVILILFVFKAVHGDKGCLYGWYLSDDETACYVKCLATQLSYSNVYCNFLALKNVDFSYDSSTNVLSMPSGDSMGTSKTSLIPSCYNVTLRNDQYNVTTDGFIRIAPHLMEISLTNVIQMTSTNVTLCHPTSPQLLQCNALSLPSGSYEIINETILSVPDKDITAFLGDFYVNNEAIAFFCPQSSPDVYFNELPRCNMAVLQHTDYLINEDGSMTVYKANVTIKNPLHSINYSQHAIVCFPLSLDFLNCPLKKKMAQYLYYTYPNLTLLNLYYRGFVAPFDYYITIDLELNTCVTPDMLLTAPAILDLLYQCFDLLSGLALCLTVVFKFKMFMRNVVSRCLFCHIVALIILYLCLSVTLFYPEVDTVSCYVIFLAGYYFNMAAFFWLNVVAYDSWRFFSRIKTVKSVCDNNYCDCCWILPWIHFPRNDTVKFVLYNVFCWSLAAVLLAVILFLDFAVSPYDFRYEIRPYVLPFCFFSTFKSFLVFYYLPMTVSTVTNLVFLGLTIRILRRASAGTELVNCNRRKQVYALCMKLFILMGFCWSVDCICYGFGIFNNSVFQDWFLSIGLTSLQGVIVSVIYCTGSKAFTNICLCQNKPKCR